MGDGGLYEFELLSLVAKITQEILNYTAINDKTLAEFVISLHEQSKSLQDFKKTLKETGADFPDSFVENIDRLILSMHPKHKKKPESNGTSGKENMGTIDEKEKKRRLFPGLALPDQEWQRSEEKEKDIFMKEVDEMMAQLEGVQKKKAAVDHSEDMPPPKRQRQDRSRSPRRRSPSPPRGRRDDRYSRDRDDRSRRQLDERPVLYKIYKGKVSTLKDFGAFVSLEGVAGRAEGLR